MIRSFVCAEHTELDMQKPAFILNDYASAGEHRKSKSINIIFKRRSHKVIREHCPKHIQKILRSCILLDL